MLYQDALRTKTIARNGPRSLASDVSPARARAVTRQCCCFRPNSVPRRWVGVSHRGLWYNPLKVFDVNSSS